MIRRFLLPLALLGLSAPVLAAPPSPPATQQEVEAILAASPQGTRFGLLVVDETGREVVAVNPDQRFIPASVTKLFTTAAAYALLPGMDQPDAAGGTLVWLEPGAGKAAPDAVLYGRGDARMSSAADCQVNCLAQLADAVAARTRRVHDVIGDATLWPDQRWVPGMSWNNIGTDSGTAVAALNLDDNEMLVTVQPTTPGQVPAVQLPGYFTLRNEAVTVAAGGKTQLFVERAVNRNELRLYGTVPADAKPWSDRLGIDDPALYAAWMLKGMLEARGVKVTGQARARYRPQAMADLAMPGSEPAAAPVPTGTALASLVPPPLAEDVVKINKDSQNLHAQALFRRLGATAASEQWASAMQRKLFEAAGIGPRGFEFWDGSGMSTYNRVSPRAGIALLRWASSQPWGAAWLASMPVAGRDGTLKRRFLSTPLEGVLTAKTGTLNATNALLGTFVTAKGRRFTFALFANDVPAGSSALPTMEAVLLKVAAAN